MARTTTITVSEIHCGSCERSITTALSSLDGVLRVTPDAKTNRVKVSYDELALGEATLRSVLAEIGYEPVA